MRTHTIIFSVLAVAAFAAFRSASPEPWRNGSKPSAEARASQAETYLFPPQNVFSPEEKENGDGEAGMRSAHQEPQAFHAVSDEPAPETDSAAGLVADLKTAQTYWAREARARWPLASITKLVTAAFAKSRLKPSDAVELTKEAFSRIGDAGSGELFAGEAYSAEDLIRAMLLFSSNESAEALAEKYGLASPESDEGGREEFLAGMNALVAEWGATATHFEDPTGLSVANQSTAFDIAAVARTVYEQYPDLLAITRTPRMPLAELGTGRRRTYENINKFAGRPDFIGGKTGYTDEAEGNLVSLFAYEGRPIVIVVLGSRDRFGATEDLLQWFRRTHTSR